MRKLIILSVAIFLSIPFVFAQNADKESQERVMIKQLKRNIKANKGNVVLEEQQLGKARAELRKLEEMDVNTKIKTQFNADFSGATNVTWQQNQYYTEAKFTRNGNKITAYYNANAHLVGTTQNVKFSDLPTNAQKQIRKNYSDYNVELVFLFRNNEAEMNLEELYGVQFETRECYIVELGKGNQGVVLQVLQSGEVFYCKNIEL